MPHELLKVKLQINFLQALQLKVIVKITTTTTTTRIKNVETFLGQVKLYILESTAKTSTFANPNSQLMIFTTYNLKCIKSNHLAITNAKCIIYVIQTISLYLLRQSCSDLVNV